MLIGIVKKINRIDFFPTCGEDVAFNTANSDKSLLSKKSCTHPANKNPTFHCPFLGKKNYDPRTTSNNIVLEQGLNALNDTFIYIFLFFLSVDNSSKKFKIHQESCHIRPLVLLFGYDRPSQEIYLYIFYILFALIA